MKWSPGRRRPRSGCCRSQRPRGSGRPCRAKTRTEQPPEKSKYISSAEVTMDNLKRGLETTIINI